MATRVLDQITWTVFAVVGLKEKRWSRSPTLSLGASRKINRRLTPSSPFTAEADPSLVLLCLRSPATSVVQAAAPRSSIKGAVGTTSRLPNRKTGTGNAPSEICL